MFKINRNDRSFSFGICNCFRYSLWVNGAEFIRRAKRYARESGLKFRFESGRGKGSHGMPYLGDKATVLKREEISKALLHAMLKKLGIEKEVF